MIITTQEQLDDVCAQLSTKPYLAIDTEFLRDKTYYSRLCLIQLAGPGVDAVAIDPIEHDLDFTSFNALMQNEKVVKVFHAARQDLEIFYQMTDDIPTPLFDTQVAAMVCGYGNSIAYYKLVESITGITLSKNAQFTDWARRPLTKKQLNYALDDVIYLCEVYEKLSEQLEEKGRNNWVLQEMDILRDPNTYDIPLDIVWKRIKIRSDKPEVLAVLRELAAWREEEARERDLPRGRVIKDEALADIAVYMPKNIEELSRIRNVPKDMTKGAKGQNLLDIVAHARASNKKDWPKQKRGTPFPRGQLAILEMLKLLLKVTCAEANVAPKLVANVKDLEEIATSKNPKCLAMKGWRYEVFGKEAAALKQGKITLGVKNDKIHLYRV